MLEARIYVGLRDRDSHEQIFDTERYKDALKDICRGYKTPFSLQVIEGGYFHDDGSWVDENTLLITLVGAPRKTVYDIANDVCTAFHQESVMITCNNVVHFDVRDRRNLKRRRFPGGRGIGIQGFCWMGLSRPSKNTINHEHLT